MNIFELAPAWISVPPKDQGGTETMIFNLVEELVRRGHYVALYATGDSHARTMHIPSPVKQALQPRGVPWSSHLQAPAHFFAGVEHLRNHQRDFDVVHIHLSSATDMYLFPLMFLAGIKIPVVVTVHGNFPFDRAQTPGGRWEGDGDGLYLPWMTADNMHIVAISEAHKRQIEGFFARVDPDHRLNFAGVVHHGIAPEMYAPTAEPEDFFLWLGRVNRLKGLHTAIAAARQAGARLVIAGAPDPNIVDDVRYFQEEIRPELDSKGISYVGAADFSTKLNLLSRARALLNPIELEEPFGLVMIEALMAGCPVIAFKRGAAPEIVVDGVAGFVVEDLEGMVARMGKVQSLNRPLVRLYAKGHFSAAAMTEKYEGIFSNLVVQPAEEVQATSTGYVFRSLRLVEAARTYAERAYAAKSDVEKYGYHEARFRELMDPLNHL